MSAMPPGPPPAAELSCEDARDLAAGFVLGALDASEAAAVREHLATCSEPHPEYGELGGVVPYLAESLEPVEPPLGVRARILDAVAADERSATPRTEGQAAAGSEPATVAAAVAVAGPAPIDASGPPIAIDDERARRRRSPLAWAAAIAAVLVIAGLGAWNLQLRSAAESDQAYQAAVEDALAVATAPGGQAAILAPAVAGGPSGLAGIGADGSITVAMHDLVPTTGTAVYEAWVIGADQNPVAIGSFTVDSTGLGVLTDGQGPVAPGVVIALTHEPRAGMTSPTPPVLSSGIASGRAQG